MIEYAESLHKPITKEVLYEPQYVDPFVEALQTL